TSFTASTRNSFVYLPCGIPFILTPPSWYFVIRLWCPLYPSYLILSTVKSAYSAENIQSFTAEIISAYGGKSAVENVRSVYMKGKIRAFAFDDKGTYVYYLKRRRKLRVDIKYTRSTEERILGGNKGYESSGAGFYSASGDRYLAIVYQYEQLDLPYGLLNDTYRITYEGRADVNGIKAQVLRLSSTGGLPVKIYVDAKNFFIIKTSCNFRMGTGMVTLSSEFSDFRRVQGIVFPYMMTNFAAGQKIAEIAVEGYEINADIEDSIFQPARASDSLLQDPRTHSRRFRVACQLGQRSYIRIS
nr:hypothetical protein [Desulfobacteraceae bacterium]